jgi:hypothetical protein
MVETGNLLDAAELLRASTEQAGKLNDYFSELVSAVDGSGAGKGGHFAPRELHSELMRLDPRVVVTTNYDRIFERASGSGFKVHSHDSTSIGSELRGGSPLLIKLHGSVDNSEDMIITRTDYSRVRRNGAHALSTVQSLLMTRPAVFVGYGFRDPDMLLLLENVVGNQHSAPSHYLLTGDDIPKHAESMYATCYGTATVKFRAQDFVDMEHAISEFGDLVDVIRAESRG